MEAGPRAEPQFGMANDQQIGPAALACIPGNAIHAFAEKKKDPGIRVSPFVCSRRIIVACRMALCQTRHQRE